MLSSFLLLLVGLNPLLRVLDYCWHCLMRAHLLSMEPLVAYAHKSWYSLSLFDTVLWVGRHVSEGMKTHLFEEGQNNGVKGANLKT